MSSAVTLWCESASVIISVCRATGVIWDELCSTLWSAENSIIVASINHQEVPEKHVSCWSSDTEPVIRRENLTWIRGRTVALWVKLRWLPFSDHPALKNLSDLSAAASFRVINLGTALKTFWPFWAQHLGNCLAFGLKWQCEQPCILKTGIGSIHAVKAIESWCELQFAVSSCPVIN